MKKSLTFLLITASILTYGQMHQFGLKGGIAKTFVESSVDIPYGSEKFGAIGGLTYEYVSPMKLFAGAELLYQQRGLKEDYLLPYSYELITTTHHFNYLTLVAKGGVQFGKRGCFYFNVGLTPSYLINAKISTPAVAGSILYLGGTQDISNDVNKLDLGGIAEIGGGFGIGEQMLICASLSYQKSFTSVTTNIYYKDESIKHYGIGLCLGVKYRLFSEQNEK